MRLLSCLPAHLMQQAGVREHLGYFCKREALMQYPHSQRLGWPIGSWMVESANKVVVQTRLKGAGMHWEASHVNPMLTLRNAVCNERWQACWQEICMEQSRHLTLTHSIPARGLGKIRFISLQPRLSQGSRTYKQELVVPWYGGSITLYKCDFRARDGLQVIL